jgi:hypothetical protein
MLKQNPHYPLPPSRIKNITKGEKVKPTPTSPIQELKKLKKNSCPPSPFKNKQKITKSFQIIKE